MSFPSCSGLFQFRLVFAVSLILLFPFLCCLIVWLCPSSLSPFEQGSAEITHKHQGLGMGLLESASAFPFCSSFPLFIFSLCVFPVLTSDLSPDY